jgi:hypothetical protein
MALKENMMIQTGQLTISDGVSELDGMTLAKAPLSGNPFKRATTFLRQDCNLRSGNPIWVEGVNDTIGELPVIVISDAGPPPPPALVATARAARKVNALVAGVALSSGLTSSDRKGGEKGSAKKTGSKKTRAKSASSKKSGMLRKASPRKDATKKLTRGRSSIKTLTNRSRRG